MNLLQSFYSILILKKSGYKFSLNKTEVALHDVIK